MMEHIALDYLAPAPVSEREALVLNITTPAENTPGGPFPVMVWIHGGGFVFAGPSHPGYDCTNLVSYSSQRETPVVIVSIGYRVGLGGFLASRDIKEDLAKDGHSGVGNLGLLDQQLALHWIQKYIGSFGGDKKNVTVFGESAGGISIAHHLVAKKLPVFHRAILMSGNLHSIATWSLEQHEKRYQALLRYLKIDSGAPDPLEQLRNVPEEVICAATEPIECNDGFTFQNICDDGVFHSDLSWDAMGRYPEQLKSIMIGNTRDEGVLWRFSLRNKGYEYFLERFSQYMSVEHAEKIFNLYGIKHDLPREEISRRFERIAGDACFILQDHYAVHKSNKTSTYAYHIDQEASIVEAYEGLAHHAIDLSYVFLTITPVMNPSERSLAYKMAGHWIDFAYGRDPYEKFSEGQRWMVYGPKGQARLMTEAEDEPVRKYQVMKEIERMGLQMEFQLAIEDACMMTFKLGTF